MTYSDFKKKTDEIKIPDKKLNYAISLGIKKGRKKNHVMLKKITYACCAAVLLFTLFISTAFVSPAMAQVVSRILI